MPRSKLVQARDLTVGETVFLNDAEARDQHSAYYLDLSYLNAQYIFDTDVARVGQVLETSHSKTSSRIEILSIDGRIVEFNGDPLQRFLVSVPKSEVVENLRRGDEILMRGDFNPARWSSNCEYALIASRHGYSSSVVRIRKRWRGDFKLTVRFAELKKFRFAVDAGTTFDISPV